MSSDNMNEKFFLCFSDEDSKLVRKIVSELDYELKGKMSSALVTEGDDINDAVFKRIEEAEVFIVFISELSKSSYYVKECVVRALNLNKNIVPIEIEKHSLFSTLPEEFKFRDKPYSFNSSDSKAKLLAQLKSFLGVNVESGDSFGALIHVVTDRSAQIFRYGELLGTSSPGSDFKIRLKKGTHRLDFVDEQDPSMRYSISYSVKDNDSDQFLEINLEKCFREQELKEEKARREEEMKRKLEEQQLQKRLEYEQKQQEIELQKNLELERKRQEIELQNQREILRKKRQLLEKEKNSGCSWWMWVVAILILASVGGASLL